jgi:S-adenosylmethionine synthetase
VRPGSRDLVELFLRQGHASAWLANDTSFGVGYAPASDLERVVLVVARRLRELAASPETPEIGEDVKVMGVRRGGHISLTVACAFVARFVRDIAQYVELRRRLAENVAAAARAVAANEVAVDVNAADDIANSSVYLTVTGISAEAGDDGQVGRGNRVNGLITPYRPMTLEAAAGKNPVSHVGKIYNVAAHRMAARLVDTVAGIAAAECFLVSQIGCRIEEPHMTNVRVRLRDGVALADVDSRVIEVVHDELREMPSLWRRVLRGEIAMY